MENSPCQVCDRDTAEGCVCGAYFCSVECQREAWDAGHKHLHERYTFSESTTVANGRTRKLLRTFSRSEGLRRKGRAEVPEVQVESAGDLYNHVYIRYRRVGTPELVDAFAEVGAAVVQRIAQKRMGKSKTYPYIKKPPFVLLEQLHSSIYEAGLRWRNAWGLPRDAGVKLAYMMEVGFEEFFLLADVKLYMSLVTEDTIDELQKSGFSEEIPSEEERDQLRHTLRKKAFQSRRWMKRLLRVAGGDDFVNIDKDGVRAAWGAVVDSLSMTAIFVFSERFRDDDREGLAFRSQIVVRVAAMASNLMDNLMDFGQAILNVAPPGGQERSSESVGLHDVRSVSTVWEI